MAARKAYPLRLREDILEAVSKWADDDLRSVNGQIEYLLRDALWRSGRLKRSDTGEITEAEAEGET
jgi:hypothetical protein